MEKLKLQLKAHKLITVIMGVLLVGGVALAYQGYAPRNVCESGATCNSYEAAQSEPLGAVSGPDIYSPYLAVNGVTKWYFKEGLRQATTTTESKVSRVICSVKSPNATSTLAFQVTNWTTASTSATKIYTAKGTTAFATTTAIGTAFALGASAQATLFASTTAAELATEATVFAPNTYFVQSMSGGSVGNVSPVGKCQGIFIESQ